MPLFNDKSPVVQTAQKMPVTYRKITDDDIYKLGSESANKRVTVSKKILSSVTVSDTDEFGKKLNSLISLSKQLNPNEIAKPSFFKRLFNTKAILTEKIKSQYDSVEQRMNALCLELDEMADKRRKRVLDLDQMYIENEDNYKSLQKDVEEGNQMLLCLQEEYEDCALSKDAFAAEELARITSRINTLKKRIDDFERGMQLCIFAAPDIRMQQEHNRALASSVRDIKVTTIPAWQGVFSRYILAIETKKSAELVTAVYDATDEAFRMQADQLLENTVAVANAQQRSIVSVETLQHIQQQLIASIDQACEIERQGSAAREVAKPQLQQLTQDLINRYQGVSKNGVN